MASLLHRDDKGKLKSKQESRSQNSYDPPKSILSKGEGVLTKASVVADSKTVRSAAANNDRISSGLVRFNVPDDTAYRDRQMKLRLQQLSRRRSLKQYRHGKVRDGEILKMEKMLVRVESTCQPLPDDFDENNSVKVVTRIIEKWQEFLVVCRETSYADADHMLQFYKSRVSMKSA
jgi:hypothetical protein